MAIGLERLRCVPEASFTMRRGLLTVPRHAAVFGCWGWRTVLWRSMSAASVINLLLLAMLPVLALLLSYAVAGRRPALRQHIAAGADSGAAM
jgi:hypothetical protein